MRIGVLGLQGAFAEHLDALRTAFEKRGIDGTARIVRRPGELAEVDGVVIPGGESTTISKLLRKFELQPLLVQRAREEDLPILGTCAGAILLASEGDRQVQGTGTQLLGLMDMRVDRNAFGRQRESFEAPVHLKLFEDAFPAVFIRAPAIERTWGDCVPLGTVDFPLPGLGDQPVVAARNASEGADEPQKWVVAARQGNRLALAFHPELTGDERLHGHFVDVVQSWLSGRS